jgi:hypothetical protein
MAGAPGLYCAEQIAIPTTLPDLLKQFTKVVAVWKNALEERTRLFILVSSV